MKGIPQDMEYFEAKDGEPEFVWYSCDDGESYVSGRIEWSWSSPQLGRAIEKIEKMIEMLMASEIMLTGIIGESDTAAIIRNLLHYIETGETK